MKKGPSSASSSSDDEEEKGTISPNTAAAVVPKPPLQFGGGFNMAPFAARDAWAGEERPAEEGGWGDQPVIMMPFARREGGRKQRKPKRVLKKKEANEDDDDDDEEEEEEEEEEEVEEEEMNDDGEDQEHARAGRRWDRRRRNERSEDDEDDDDEDDDPSSENEHFGEGYEDLSRVRLPSTGDLSPRGGGEAMTKWIEQWKNLTKEKTRAKKKDLPSEDGVLPSLEELQVLLKAEEANEKMRRLKNKMFELRRMRRAFDRGDSRFRLYKGESKKLQKYQWDYLASEACTVKKLTLPKSLPVESHSLVVSMPRLKELLIISCDDTMVKLWLPSLLKSPNLVKIKFFNCIGVVDVAAFFDALSLAKNLESLSLTVRLSQATADLLGTTLSRNFPRLKNASLCFEEGNAEDFTQLAKIFSCGISRLRVSGLLNKKLFSDAQIDASSQLKRLKLEETSGSFARLLQLPLLQKISIDSVNFSVADSHELGLALASPDCSLTQLSIKDSCHGLNTSFIAHGLNGNNGKLQSLRCTERRSDSYVLMALASKSMVRKFSLSFARRDRLTIPGEKSLLGAFQRNLLNSVTLDNLSMSFVGLEQALSACNSITKLVLRSVRLAVGAPRRKRDEDDDESSSHEEDLWGITWDDCGGSPAVWKKLEHFGYHFCEVFPTFLSGVLEGNTRIKELDVSYGTGVEHEEAMLAALKDCSSMETIALDLDWAETGTENFPSLVEAAVAMPKLRELVMGAVIIDEVEDKDIETLFRLKLQTLDISGFLISFNVICSLLLKNPTLETLVVDADDESVIESMVPILMICNTHLTKFESVSFEDNSNNAMDRLCRRNRAMRHSCAEAVRCLLAIRAFRRDEVGWWFLPKELVLEMAKLLWSTRFERCWFPRE